MASSTQDVVLSDIIQRQTIIDDACSLFIQIGFPSEMFTIRKIHEHGYNDKDFMELIRPLYSMEDQEELTRLTASIPKNDLGKFIEQMEFLRTKEGIQSVYDAFTRISKKNVVMTEEGVALAHKLVGYAAAQRLTRENILGKINELMRCQRELEKQSLNIDEDLKIKLGPLYEYKEPSLHELRIEAYKLYESECKAKRIPAFPIDHEKGFETAIQKFGAVAKNHHLLSYLNDPIRKERIEKHFKEGSFRFEYVAGDEEEEGDGGNRGGRSYEIFELAADSGEANEALATKIVHKFTSEVFSDKPQPPVVDSLSSGETNGSYVSNSAESVEPVNETETPENLVKPAKVQSPDSKKGKTETSENLVKHAKVQSPDSKKRKTETPENLVKSAKVQSSDSKKRKTETPENLVKPAKVQSSAGTDSEVLSSGVTIKLHH